ncbi:angiotensin-converting enzyme [Cephus cinctus]|uniref:Angiotensin-converting enzyme n=1 Tax=Cephus cinctus TaxID=211228 RepID=A0AAJ7W5M2_CEPCN|nr:angiotensin-converting enzyme [Cephus cinctus]
MIPILILGLFFHPTIGSDMDDIIRKLDGIANKEDLSALLLRRMNAELMLLNRASADLEWLEATSPSPEVSQETTKLSHLKTTWRNFWCAKTPRIHVGPAGSRMLELLCRGPKYTPHQAKALTAIFKELSTSYVTATVCRIEENQEKCYNGEPELERLMSTSRNESELRWAWTSWRNEMSKVKGLFTTAVTLQNLGARNNGYHDLGECWREELESPHLETLVDQLYQSVEPLYRLLHAVVRFRLAEVYPGLIDLRGPIPAHLLGNMWSQNWESLVDLLMPNGNIFGNVNEALIRKNYTVRDMVERAEDFYTSLGLPPMSREFWERSIFEKDNRTKLNCHATAANMYKNDDFRVLACLQVSAQDFYVIHHEMGHIQYYMAYKNQPAIFMDGANSAFHEAVGDAIMYGVLTPQHMQRLGLANDSALSNDLPLLLKQALGKLPQMPHALIMDKWRWDVFSGKIKDSLYNKAWWELNKKYLGIEPPVARNDDSFDPAAKFHITDNTPYIRYFLGYVLQVQLFEGMCQAAVTGKVGDPLFKMPLHRCDIYGSKDAGRRLK